MKLLWIKWANGIETRDDGFAIYHDVRFTMLKQPDGKVKKFQTVTEAKKAADNVGGNQ